MGTLTQPQPGSAVPAARLLSAPLAATFPFLDMTVSENLEVAQYSIAPFINVSTARRERDALLDAHRPRRRRASAGARVAAAAAQAARSGARAGLKPRVVLLDEVGAGLVDSEISELIVLIRSILDDRTAIVIVEHVLRIVRECCARSLVLNFGKKLVEGPTAEILANDEVAAVYLGTGGARRTTRRRRRCRSCRRPSRKSEDAGAADRAAPQQRRAAGAAAKASTPATARRAFSRASTSTVREGEAVAILAPTARARRRWRASSAAPSRRRRARAIAGKDVAGWPPHRIAALGVAHCMEGRRIFPTLTVEENLRVAARGVAAAAARQRLAAVYDLFPVLAERAGQCRHVDVRGQQQMLAIGRALMARPRLVIFDEISLGLAPVMMDKLYEALAILKQAGVTQIVIEQDVDRALSLVDFAYVLEHGRFGLSGKPADIVADPRLRHIYIGAAD